MYDSQYPLKGTGSAVIYPGCEYGKVFVPIELPTSMSSQSADTVAHIAVP